MSTRHLQDNQRTKSNETERLRKLERLPTLIAGKRLLFVGGIPRVASPTEVLIYLEQFGIVEYFSMPLQKESGYHMGFAKLLFVNDRQGKIFKSYQNHFIKEKEVGVKDWVPRDEHVPMIEQPSLNKLFFKFQAAVSEHEVHEYFSRYGLVESVQLVFNHVTKKVRDFGFIEFRYAKTAQNLLVGNTNHIVNGKTVKLFPSKERDELKKYSKAENTQPITCRKPISEQALPSRDRVMMKEQELYRAYSNENDFRFTMRKPAQSRDGNPVRAEGSIQKVYPDITDRMTKQPAKIREKCIKSRQIDFKEVDSRQIPVSKDEFVSHMVKPCSKYWHHSQLAGNHQIRDNLAFTCLVPSRLSRR